jgi:hypothetical protein
MENNKNNTENLPQVRGIPESILNDIEEDIKTKGKILYARIHRDHISLQDRDRNDSRCDSIIARITSMERCWISWETDDGKPAKTISEEKPSDDYKLQCELWVRTSDGHEIKFMLSTTSYSSLRKFLQPYVQLNIDIETIPIRISTREGTYKGGGVYGVATFEEIDGTEVEFVSDNNIVQAEVDNNSVDNDDIPF